MSSITRIEHFRNSPADAAAVIAAALRRVASTAAPANRRLRSKHYRRRAQELRAIAEEVILRDTQVTLLNLADSYDHMATVLDERAAGEQSRGDKG